MRCFDEGGSEIEVDSMEEELFKTQIECSVSMTGTDVAELRVLKDKLII